MHRKHLSELSLRRGMKSKSKKTQSFDKTVKGFDVFRNGEFLGFIGGQSKKIRQSVVRKLVLSTHMGEWVRTPKGIEYGTTIGVYILFQPCRRLTAVLANYRIEGVG